MTRLQPFFSTIEQSIGNLHLAEIQVIVRKELKGKSGIYGFLSKTNNKLYIGSSIDLSTRFNHHIKGSRSNALLQRAINKYSLQDFIFIIFEYCEPEELMSREQFYMDTLEPEYNILKTAGSLLGFKHTTESCVKMKILKSEEHKAKISISKKGSEHKDLTKLKISISKKGIRPNDQTKLKMSIAQGTSIYVYSSDGITLMNTFTSANMAGKYFNCSYNTILSYVKSGKLFKNKWILLTSIIKE